MCALRLAADPIRRHPDLAACGLIVAVVCAFFAPLFTGHQLGQSHILWEAFPWLADKPSDLTVTPRDGEGDAALHYHPILSLAREQLHDGVLPLWNPSSYSGMPLFGNLQSALLFPLTWLAMVLPVEVAFGWIALLRLVLAGIGAYLLARRFGAGPAGSLVAGLIYALSAPLVLWVQHMLGTELALLPWVLLATERLARRPDRRGFVLMALAVAAGIFAGHPETAALNALAAAVFLAVMVLRTGRGWRPLAAFVGAHALGTVAAAIVLVPFGVAYADSITRVTHDGGDLHLPPSWVLTFALPEVFGDGRPGWWGPTGSSLGGYFGIGAALLAGVGLVRHRADPRVVALAASALFMGMVAFDVPPVGWIIDVLPLFKTMVALRVSHVVALAAAVAAGLAVHALMRRPLALRKALAWSAAVGGVVVLCTVVLGVTGRLPAPRDVEVAAALRFAVALLAGAACLLVLGRLRRALALAAVLVVVVGDLWYLQGFNALLEPRQAYPGPTAGIRFLQDQREPFHVSTIRPPGQAFVLPPNTASLYGFESIQGYDIPAPRRWADLSYFVLGERGPSRLVVSTTPAPQGAALKALRMLNTRFLLAAPRTPKPDPSFEVAYSGPDLTIFRDPLALPRAYVVPATRPMSDRDALDTLADGRFEPSREALVPRGAASLSGRADQPLRPARFERLGPGHVRIHLPAGADGWLVVAQSHSRQWDAEVDGRSVPTYPTNYVATGLRVTPGMRTVDLEHDRTAELTGAAISLCAFALMAFLAFGRYGGRTSRGD